MNPLDHLTHELAKLPGVGEKTALRLAIHILRQPASYAQSLSQALISVVEKIRFCPQCFHLTDSPLCSICTDGRRDPNLLCVVEESSDLWALERTRNYRGIYHVLQGTISPLDGIGPDELKIRELIDRLGRNSIREVILATNPNVTGDATALYLSKLVKPLGIRITRLAAGLPVGGDIEYIDGMTLSRALEARVEY